jgi:trehalose 6-phosphate phosphatase
VPEQAAVLPGCRRALDRLRQRLDLVAVISGRPGAEAKRLLGLDGIVYLGNHGLDPWIGAERPGVPCGRQGGPPGRASVLAALDEMKEALAGQPGLRFEDMGATISVRSLVTAVPERVEALAEEPVDVPG